MHALNTGIARDFNRKYGFRGHALEDRYHAELIERDEHLLEVLRYVPLNPVRAGLCARPESWRWSSYASVIRARPALDFIAADEVRRLFGRQPTVAEQRYRAFVEDGVRALACA